MLGTLLQNLQTLLSRAFVVTYFVPSLAFAFANGLMLYWVNARFRTLAVAVLSGSAAWRSSLLLLSALIAIAVFAYCMSALAGRFRSLLEGNWPEPLVRLFVGRHALRRERLEGRIARVIVLRSSLERDVNEWKGRLRTAREAGAKTKTCSFDSQDPAAVAIAELRARHLSGALLEHRDLESAVEKLQATLTTNNADAPEASGRNRLDAYQQLLVNLIDADLTLAQLEHMELMNKLQFNFPQGRLAPTAMGNIARTIQSYAVTRYNFNLEVFWSRLQKALQRDDKSYSAIQDSKSQLDFLTASCWLTGGWTVVWTLTLLCVAHEWWPFVTVAIAGPLGALVWYGIAVEQYRAFADLLRSSVDLFRFELLRDLRINAPADLHDERLLWDDLNRLVSYGEDPNFRFSKPVGQ